MVRRGGGDGGVGWSSNNSRGSGKMASSQAVWGLPPGSFTVATGMCFTACKAVMMSVMRSVSVFYLLLLSFLMGMNVLGSVMKSIYDGGDFIEKSYHSSLLLSLIVGHFSLYGFFASAVPGNQSTVHIPPK
jgi:hypothetical protein